MDPWRGENAELYDADDETRVGCLGKGGLSQRKFIKNGLPTPVHDLHGSEACGLLKEDQKHANIAGLAFPSKHPRGSVVARRLRVRL